MKPVLPPIAYTQYIKPNDININSQVSLEFLFGLPVKLIHLKIMEVFINKILPAIVSSTEDIPEWYGSTATADIAVLQAISKRVHMGKHVAEVRPDFILNSNRMTN